MARARLYATILDAAGNRLSGATVDVFQVGTTTPITATMYNAVSGGSTLANPLTTDSFGSITAYVDTPQNADLRIQLAGYSTRTIGGAHFEANPDDTVVTFGPPGYPVDVALTEDDGTATTSPRSDHRHAIADGAVTSRKVNLTVGTADVATSQTTTSTSYTDLATVGPAVTLSPGITQEHLIHISARMQNDTDGARTHISVAIAGAAAVDADGAEFTTVTNQPGTYGRSILASAVASGSTHTMKYKVASGIGTYFHRRIIGMAI